MFKGVKSFTVISEASLHPKNFEALESLLLFKTFSAAFE